MREIVPPAELGQPVCYAVRVHWLSVILSKQKALFSVILTQPQPLRVLPCPVLPKELHRFRWQRNPTIRSRGFWRILIYAYGDEQTAYLSPANYDAKPATADFSTRQREIKKLISALSSIAIPPSDHEYIRHQWDKHDNVPLWAAVKVLTLGNISKMYSLCTESIQIEVAKEFPKVTSEAMMGMLDMLTRVRNVCAHSERLYDFSVKRSRAILDMPAHATLGIAKSKSGLYNQGKKDLFASLICLKYLLEQDEFDEVVMSIDAALCKLHSKTKVLPPNKILSCMGFPENWVDIREC